MDSPTDDAGVSTVYARAKHPFVGKNNDELTFNVGDVIAVTQQDEGGEWWEGTLNGETGWFPCGFVSVLTEKDKLLRSRSAPNANASALLGSAGMNGGLESASSKKEFAKQVYGELQKSEDAHLEVLKTVLEQYIDPLSKDRSVLSQDDFDTIVGCIAEFYEHQAAVLNQINVIGRQDPSQQRLGGMLLSNAPRLKQLLTAYSANHPRAVQIVSAKRAAIEAMFKDRIGPVADVDHMKTFIQGLSEPFRHLSQYAPSLIDLHRNMQESHPDRGDVHRACAVYRDIKSLCESVRRQHEMQLDFLATPRIQEYLSHEGRGQELLRFGMATVTKGADSEDRCLALFTPSLLVLIMAGDASDYEIVQSLPVSALAVTRVPGEHVLKIMHGSEVLLVELPSSFELEQWTEALARAGVRIEEETNGRVLYSEIIPSALRRRTEEPEEEVEMGTVERNYSSIPSPLDDPILRRNKPPSMRKAMSPLNDVSSSGGALNHSLEMWNPDAAIDDDFMVMSGGRRRSSSGAPNESGGFCLRAYPPYRVLTNASKKGFKMRKEAQLPLQEQGDAALLNIIEGYLELNDDEADTFRPRHDATQLIVADDEKLLVEEEVDGQTVVRERSLVDVVYALKDQMDGLTKEMSALRGQLEKEQRARRRLEDSIKRSSLHMTTSTPKPFLDTSS